MVFGLWYELGKFFSVLVIGVLMKFNKDNLKKKSGYFKVKIKIILVLLR